MTLREPLSGAIALYGDSRPRSEPSSRAELRGSREHGQRPTFSDTTHISSPSRFGMHIVTMPTPLARPPIKPEVPSWHTKF